MRSPNYSDHPPGNKGFRDTPPVLSPENLNQYHTDGIQLCILLFDEIEKASFDLWQLLLSVMERARLTLADNRAVDLSKAMIFLTSNLGGREISNLIDSQDFSPSKRLSASELSKEVERIAIGAARKKFSLEFMSRLDKVIVFKPLTKKALKKILEIELAIVQKRIFDNKLRQSFVFTTSQAAKAYLLQVGTNSTYGARHLKRTVQSLLVQSMSNEIALGRLRGGDHLYVHLDPATSQLTFRKEAENLSMDDMLRLVSLAKTSSF
jgi:ATP-dependent Clp protease ATP-binding subunit ClpA